MMKNLWFIDGDHACLQLTKRQWTLVDVSDLALLQQYKWGTVGRAGRYYAATYPSGKVLYMHQLLLGVKGVDHINGNGLDNRRENIRAANQSQNNANRHGVKGVWYDRGWRACIEWEGRRQTKRFATEEEALTWRREQELVLFGEFAPPREEQH